MNKTSCIFCARAQLQLVAENELALAVRDIKPMRHLHTLIIPKRHSEHIFDTTTEEREALHALASHCRAAIMAEDPSVSGFNFGSNIGVSAGQKIFHTHLHLIPRRHGEAELAAAQPD